MSAPENNPRKEYLSGTGFALYTEVQDRLLKTVGDQILFPADKCIDSSVIASQLNQYMVPPNNPAGVGLYLATRSAVHNVPKQRDLKAFYASHGVSKHDLSKANPHTFHGGFMDLDFPWYFPAAVANSVAEVLVKEGVVSAEQNTAFSVGDWANMIRSGWFGKLIHHMAFGHSTVYETFGRGISSYHAGALATRLALSRVLAEGDPLFAYEARQDIEPGYTHATANLSKVATQGLRAAMLRQGNSVGCPVARTSTRLPADSLKRDPHVQALVAHGTLQVDPERSANGHLRVTQGTTSIDRTLQFFADQLDTYDVRYGTPYIKRERHRSSIAHRQLPAQDALRWKTVALNT